MRHGDNSEGKTFRAGLSHDTRLVLPVQDEP